MTATALRNTVKSSQLYWFDTHYWSHTQYLSSENLSWLNGLKMKIITDYVICVWTNRTLYLMKKMVFSEERSGMPCHLPWQMYCVFLWSCSLPDDRKFSGGCCKPKTTSPRRTAVVSGISTTTARAFWHYWIPASDDNKFHLTTSNGRRRRLNVIQQPKSVSLWTGQRQERLNQKAMLDSPWEILMQLRVF